MCFVGDKLDQILITPSKNAAHNQIMLSDKFLSFVLDVWWLGWRVFKIAT